MLKQVFKTYFSLGKVLTNRKSNFKIKTIRIWQQKTSIVNFVTNLNFKVLGNNSQNGTKQHHGGLQCLPRKQAATLHKNLPKTEGGQRLAGWDGAYDFQQDE